VNNLLKLNSLILLIVLRSTRLVLLPLPLPLPLVLLQLPLVLVLLQVIISVTNNLVTTALLGAVRIVYTLALGYIVELDHRCTL